MSYTKQAVTRLTLDMGLPDIQKSVSVTQGDTNRRLEVTLIDRGSPFALPPTWTAVLAGVLPGGDELYESCIVDDGRIIFDFVAAPAVSSEEGVFGVSFDIFDEGGEVVASPKLWVHVTAGVRRLRDPDTVDRLTALQEFVGQINRVNRELEAHAEQIHDAEEALGTHGERLSGLEDKITATGHITIPATEWTDTDPHDAFLQIPGDSFTNGGLLLLAPEDNETREACARARISVNLDRIADSDPPFYDYVWFLRAESGEIPDSPLHFVYFGIRTGAEDQEAVAAIIGVDAYGEGGGAASGVDETAVRAIITAMLGNVANERQYSASNPPPYPVTSVNGKTGAVSLTIPSKASDVGADPAGTASSKLITHNVDTASHQDFRVELQGLADRLAAVLDSDDATLDELSEIVAYIKSNKTLIDAITTSKVSVADIVDNLTTNVVNKPLSAAQGVALKALIDGLQDGKLDAAALTAAINTALAQAEASGAFKGEQGVSGVYVGSGEMPEGYNVQIDPEGEATSIEDLFGESIPEYWENYLPDKIAAIKTLQDEGGKDCFSFIVMTDMHYPSNLGKKSPLIAKKIMDGCDIKYALCLGDTQTRGCHNTKELLLAENEAIEIMLSPIRDRLLQTEGNHDGAYGRLDRDGDGAYSNKNADGSLKEPAERETYVYNLTPAEMHSVIYRKVGLVGDVHFDESGSGYYIDDTANKVRYIVLNTHYNDYELQADGTAKYPKMWIFRFTQSQFDLVIEALNSIPSASWGVVVSGHCPLTQEIGDGDVMIGVLNAYKNKTTYTGDYEGTAEGSAAHTNRAEPLPNNTTDTTKWVNGYRFSSSGISAEAGTSLSNAIACKNGDVICIKGVELRTGTDRISVTGTTFTAFAGDYFNNGLTIGGEKSVSYDGYENGIYTFTIKTGIKHTITGFRFAMPTPEDASAVIITVNEEIVEGVLSGYDAVSVDCDFSQAKGTFVGYFHGHIHSDSLNTTKGFPIIGTRSDAVEEYTEELRNERVEGTITEQSFNVFTVNKATRTIHATKIGAGADRSIKY